MLLPALLLLAAVPPVTGGTPHQQQVYQQFLEKIPACWRECDGSPKLKISKTAKEINAEYDPSKNSLTVTEASFYGSDFEKGVSQDTQDECEEPGFMRYYDGNMFATLVHELAHYHHLHAGCKQHKLVQGFLALRYKQNYRALMGDPAWGQYKKEIRALEKLKTRTPDQQKELCDLYHQRDQLVRSHGIVVRFRNDMHAVEAGDGVEYWAMAIETLVSEPNNFCRSFSAEEMAYLKENFGDCLDQMPRLADCYRQTKVPAPSAQGGAHLTP